MHLTLQHCSTLQRTAAHCSTLQRTAAHCSTLQHTAVHCSTLHQTQSFPSCTWTCFEILVQHTATQCSTLQLTATHCKTPSPSQNAPLIVFKVWTRGLFERPFFFPEAFNFSKSDYHNVCGSNILIRGGLGFENPPYSQLTPLPKWVSHCNTLQHTATHCNTLQHATHCNTLSHDAP